MPTASSAPSRSTAAATPERERYKTILLFGPPGAGKGTQGKILGKIPGFYHLACGDVFRSIDINSQLGKAFYEYSSRGELVPDDLTIEMWRQNVNAQTILSLYKPQVDLLVLDGIPRNLGQAKAMDQYIEVLGIVYLRCHNIEEMVHRMKRRALKENRLDDVDEKVVRKRFEVYERETAPVLKHYPKQIIHEVDASGSPAKVLSHVLEVVAPIQEKHFKTGME